MRLFRGGPVGDDTWYLIPCIPYHLIPYTILYHPYTPYPSIYYIHTYHIHTFISIYIYIYIHIHILIPYYIAACVPTCYRSSIKRCKNCQKTWGRLLDDVTLSFTSVMTTDMWMCHKKNSGWRVVAAWQAMTKLLTTFKSLNHGLICHGQKTVLKY